MTAVPEAFFSTTSDRVPFAAWMVIAVRGEIPLLPRRGLAATVAAGITIGAGVLVEVEVSDGAVVAGVSVAGADETGADDTGGTVTCAEAEGTADDGDAVVGVAAELDWLVDALLVQADSSAAARTADTANLMDVPRMF